MLGIWVIIRVGINEIYINVEVGLKSGMKIRIRVKIWVKIKVRISASIGIVGKMLLG